MTCIRHLTILICTLLLIGSCTNNSRNRINQNTDNTYEYVKVTPELIRELGGSDVLSQYQFFLSDGITLVRVDNDKSAKKDGAIKDIDHNYSVEFTAKTPGIFKCINEDTYHDARYQFIEIYFDEGDNDYLTFYSSREISGLYYFELYPIKNDYYSGYGNEFQFRNHNWRIKDYKTKKGPKGPIYLLLQIDHSKAYKNEIAKGRRLAE